MDKKRKEIISSNEISKINRYNLAGYNQKVLIEGKHASNPIVLALHGGPGTPIPFSVGCRGLFPEFTNEYIMVYWDQLGCGINNHEINDNFTIDKYVDMTVDLVKTIKNEFPDNKLIIFGISWGSVLAAKTASRIPDLIDGVVVYGQVLKNLFFNDEVYDTLNSKNISSSIKSKLDDMKNRTSHDETDLKNITKWIRKYTEGYNAKSDKKAPVGKIIKGLLTSPDYSFRDFVAIVKNGMLKNRSIWRELLTIDLSETLENIKVPYHILQGSTDIVTSSHKVETLISNSKNENLHFMMIDNNGHIPNVDGNDAIFEAIKLLL